MTILEAIVGATTYNLSDGSIGYRMAEAGMGIAPLTRYNRRGPRQHGTTDVGFRLEPRVVQLGFAALASSWTAHYDRRNLLMEIFKPSDDPILLRWTLPDASVRQIDAFYNGGLDFGTDGLFGLMQRVAVECYCPDPILYDPAETTETATNTTNPTPAGLVVPWSVPFSVRSGVLDTTASFVYSGTWQTYPVIELYGELVAPRIENLTTGEVINLSGAVIPDGETYTIDLRSGQKTITDSSGDSRMGELDGNEPSDLATWHIPVTDATQEIRVTATRAGRQVTVMELTWLDRFIGL